MFECPKCRKILRNKTGRARHITKDHGRVECPYQNCKSRLTGPSFDVHLSDVHEQQPRESCSICGRSVKKRNMSTHKKSAYCLNVAKTGSSTSPPARSECMETPSREQTQNETLLTVREDTRAQSSNSFLIDRTSQISPEIEETELIATTLISSSNVELKHHIKEEIAATEIDVEIVSEEEVETWEDNEMSNDQNNSFLMELTKKDIQKFMSSTSYGKFLPKNRVQDNLELRQKRGFLLFFKEHNFWCELGNDKFWDVLVFHNFLKITETKKIKKMVEDLRKNLSGELQTIFGNFQEQGLVKDIYKKLRTYLFLT